MKINIPDFSNTQVLVVGDLMLDRYWHGPTSRISPEAPVPVVSVKGIEERPGGAGNVALNIVSLGGNAQLTGLVGNDEPARVLQRGLSAAGVNCRFVQTDQHGTVTKLRILSRHQQLIRLDFEDGFAGADHGDLLQTYQAALGTCQVVVLSDYGKGTLTDLQKFIQPARKAGAKVLIDPKGTNFDRYKSASLITPNQLEFEAVVGECPTEEVFVEKGHKLIEELDLEALLITRSEKGMLLLRRGLAPLNLPTRAQEVYDVTGAGDTVIATLAAGLAAGLDTADATSLANLAAGVVVGKLGTATASVQELQNAMRAHQPLKRGVVDQQELSGLVTAAKANGERIVMTNGCFDILHAGHVAYLSDASRLGDRLIVAVNDDASVRRLKGESRPVNSLMARMAVLSAMEAVDWVVPFSEDTPARIISELLPDILVKGGDYQPEQIVGADTVRDAGGDVVVLDFIDGCSTTAIINAIRKKHD